MRYNENWRFEGDPMPFDIEFTKIAADHVRRYKKYEQQILFDAIEEQLTHEPVTETKNKKSLKRNELSDWELRVQKFRVFYDVINDEDRQVVKIKAVGHKEHNTLYIADEEVEL
jgi:mRNA-degrading endonuclease RelE of RelBE toxin-antitoxin system